MRTLSGVLQVCCMFAVAFAMPSVTRAKPNCRPPGVFAVISGNGHHDINGIEMSYDTIHYGYGTLTEFEGEPVLLTPLHVIYESQFIEIYDLPKDGASVAQYRNQDRMLFRLEGVTADYVWVSPQYDLALIPIADDAKQHIVSLYSEIAAPWSTGNFELSSDQAERVLLNAQRDHPPGISPPPPLPIRVDFFGKTRRRSFSISVRRYKDRYEEVFGERPRMGSLDEDAMLVSYSGPFEDGMSGAPLYLRDECRFDLYGVHMGGEDVDASTLERWESGGAGWALVPADERAFSKVFLGGVWPPDFREAVDAQGMGDERVQSIFVLNLNERLTSGFSYSAIFPSFLVHGYRLLGHEVAYRFKWSARGVPGKVMHLGGFLAYRFGPYEALKRVPGRSLAEKKTTVGQRHAALVGADVGTSWVVTREFFLGLKAKPGLGYGAVVGDEVLGRDRVAFTASGSLFATFIIGKLNFELEAGLMYNASLFYVFDAEPAASDFVPFRDPSIEQKPAGDQSLSVFLSATFSLQRFGPMNVATFRKARARKRELK